MGSTLPPKVRMERSPLNGEKTRILEFRDDGLSNGGFSRQNRLENRSRI